MIVCIGYCTDCNALCRGLWLGMCMSLTVHLTGLPSDYSNSLSISVGHLLTSMCLGHFLRLAAVQQACALVVLHCIGSPMIDSSQLSGKQAAAGSSRICCTTSAISRHHHSSTIPYGGVSGMMRAHTVHGTSLAGGQGPQFVQLPR